VVGEVRRLPENGLLNVMPPRGSLGIQMIANLGFLQL
jgi:hypothetical protein